MEKLTRQQVEALKSVYDRRHDFWEKPKTYLAFRRTAVNSITQGCVMVPWGNMILGIETDGHTHS
jgi:hypothetical protein